MVNGPGVNLEPANEIVDLGRSRAIITTLAPLKINEDILANHRSSVALHDNVVEGPGLGANQRESFPRGEQILCFLIIPEITLLAYF